MRPLILACLIFFGFCAGASADDLYAELNRTRTGEGSCATADRLPPLVPRATLELAAQGLARGASLQTSLDRAAYRSTYASVLTVSGEGVGERAIALLAGKLYCPQLTDARMTEVGIFQDSRSVWIVMAAPFAPLVKISEKNAGQRVLELVNQARATPRYCGGRLFKAAPPLRWNDMLAEASLLHAEDMARHNYFSHNGRDGSGPAQRVERAGYRFRSLAENIAGGQMKPEQAVAGWITSPEHCANLMNPVYTETGAAFAVDAKSEMGAYWTQAFGRPR